MNDRAGGIRVDIGPGPEHDTTITFPEEPTGSFWATIDPGPDRPFGWPPSHARSATRPYHAVYPILRASRRGIVRVTSRSRDCLRGCRRTCLLYSGHRACDACRSLGARLRFPPVD